MSIVGNGQPLVLQGVTTTLTTVPNQFNASQLEISTLDLQRQLDQSSITSGDLGGLLSARTQVDQSGAESVGPDRHRPGQSANTPAGVGLDLNGQLGANLFSVGAPAGHGLVQEHGRDHGQRQHRQPRSADRGQLRPRLQRRCLHADRHHHGRQGGAQRRRHRGESADRQPVCPSSCRERRPSGDQFLIQPTAQAAATIQVALTNPSQIAAAGAIATSASDSNTGNATIAAGTVLDAANPNLLSDDHHRSSPARPPIRSTAPAVSPIPRRAISRSTAGRPRSAARRRPATCSPCTAMPAAPATTPMRWRAPISKAQGCSPAAR